MFDHDDPKHLMDSLCKFLPIFHGLAPDGISEEKLAQVDLPYALKRVHGCVGNWVGKGYLGNPFSTQDALVPFELLSRRMDGEEYVPAHRDGKTMFVYENQCVWTCAVGNQEDSDSFYLESGTDEDPWKKMPFSLSHFLVTFMLLESIYGSKYQGTVPSGQTLDDIFQTVGYRMVPLWNGRYVESRGPTDASLFSSAEAMKILVLGNCVATNSQSLFEALEGHLKVQKESKGETLEPGSPSWDRIPLAQQKWHYEYKARALQKKVDHYSRDLTEMQRRVDEIQKKMDSDL